MAALAARGLAVGGAKVGPDFIDPGYHALATGRPARNLDAWICGASAVPPLAARAADASKRPVDGALIGTFDSTQSQVAEHCNGSSAVAARCLAAPPVRDARA